MRTNIEIDDELMAAAMKGGEFKTKREAVEAGLRLLARRAAYQKIRAMRGKLHWDDSDQPEPAWEVVEPARQAKARASVVPAKSPATTRRAQSARRAKGAKESAPA